MGAPTFWDNSERAQKHIAKLNGLKKAVLPVVAFQKKVDDVGVMLELIEAAEGAEKESYAHEVTTQVAAMNEELDAPQEQFTPSSHTNANTLANSFLLGGLEVSKDLDFSSFAVVFVGDQASSSKQGIVHDGHRQYINTILWY